MVPPWSGRGAADHLGLAVRLALAVLGPLAVVLLWLGMGGALGTVERPPPKASVATFGTAMEAEPQVVVTGTSQSLIAVDPTLLGELLDTSVVNGSFGNSTGYVLYRVLRNRVFDPGHTPKVLVVAMSLPHLKKPMERPAGGFFASEFYTPMPELDGWMRSGPLAPLLDASVSWQERRSAWVDAVAHWPEGADEAAFNEALGQHRLGNAALATRMIPVVEQASNAGSKAWSIEAGMLPLILELAASHGTRVVVATLPQRRDDLRSSDAERQELAMWLDERGAALLDLEDMTLGLEYWFDEGHVNDKGRKLYTRELGPGLLSVGALGDGPMRGSIKAMPDRFSRVGEFPPVPTLTLGAVKDCRVTLELSEPLLAGAQARGHGYGLTGAGRLSWQGRGLTDLARRPKPCSGEFRVVGTEIEVELPQSGKVSIEDFELAWVEDFPRESLDAMTATPLWLLPPGTTATWERDESVTAEVEVVLSSILPAKGRPALTISDATVPMSRDGQLWRARAPVDGPVRVSVSVPPGGPWMVVDRVTLSEDGLDAIWAQSAKVLPTSVGVLDGRNTGMKLTVEGPPLELATTRSGRRLTVELSARDEAVMHKPVRDALGAGRCSPLRMVSKSGTSHYPMYDWVLPKGETEAEWTVQRDPTRSCRANRWLYPGDTLVTWSNNPAELHAQGTHLVLRGVVFERQAHLRVVVRSKDRVHLQRAVRWEPGEDELRVPLGKPLPAMPASVVLELTSGAGAPYVLLRHASVEAAPVDDVLAAR